MKTITIEVMDNVAERIEEIRGRIDLGPRDIERVVESIVAGAVLSGKGYDSVRTSADVFESTYKRFANGCH